MNYNNCEKIMLYFFQKQIQKMNTHKFRIIGAVLFLIVAKVALFSCSSSSRSKPGDKPVDPSAADDYAILFETNHTNNSIDEDLSGNVIVIYEKDFTERITKLNNQKGYQYMGKTPCIVELYANWCKPCGYQSQLLSEMAPDYKGRVIFYKLDIERAYNVAAAFNVKSIPMILYFKPHSEIATTVGYLNKEELKDMINKFLLNP